MCQRSTPWARVLAASLLAVSAAAGAVGLVGDDTVTQSNWRTAAALEADGQYGTDGYVIYALASPDGTWNSPYDASSLFDSADPGATHDSAIALPAYIGDIALRDSTGRWSGNGNFGQIEDPETGELTNTPVIAWGPDPYVFTLTRAGSQPFRLTVICATGDGQVPTWTVTVDDGSGAATGTVTALASPNIVYLTFQIPAGTDPVTVTTEADSVDGWITGFAFDSQAAFAGSPVPADGAEDVMPGTALAWSAGRFAAEHDVYLGLDFDEVNNATTGDAVYLGRHADATLDPGRLTLGQTYFWRVDEVNGAPDPTVFRGGVWRFTVEPVAFPVSPEAVGVTASSHGPDQLPAHAADGSGLAADDSHSDDTDDMWASEADDAAPWIQFDLAQLEELEKLRIWNHNSQTEGLLGLGIKELRIETSRDGQTWATLKTVTLPQAPGLLTYTGSEVGLDHVVAQAVRLVPLSNWSTLGIRQVGLSEVRFYAVPTRARRPVPAEGDTVADPQVTLSWRSGRHAVQHDVRAGSDPNALHPVATVADPLATLSVDLGSRTYWQITEVNETADPPAWDGPVWSFAAGAFLSVDDMEGYTSEDGAWIWETWADGFDDAGNGALLGHDGGNDMDRSTAVDGTQSLPYYYGEGGAAVSLASRPLSGDWTRHGIQSLSLMFRGAPANTPGAMTLLVNGARVPYGGAAADLTRPVWQAWVVDLADLGIDLAQVTELGLEIAGGSGVVLIDAIRLYPQPAQVVVPVLPDGAGLVAQYALEGDATDASGLGADGTLQGDPLFLEGVSGQALFPDGVDDFIDLGVPTHWPDGNEPRTLSAWAKTLTVGPGWRVIVAYGSPAAGQAAALAANGTLVSASGYGRDVTLDGFWEEDTWHHIGMTYDGRVTRLYVDGVPAGSGERVFETTISTARIGRQVNDAPEFWDGAIDDVRLYDRALSPAEMAGLAGRTEPVTVPF